MVGYKPILAAFSAVVFVLLPETDALGPAFVLAVTPGVAVGGLVTGIIGTVLGGVAIAAALGKIDLGVEEEEEMMMYGYGRRRRRSADNIHEVINNEKVKVEQFLDDVYRSDSSQCLEKIVCDITKKFVKGEEITEGENDILKLVNSNQSKGYTYKKMLMAEKVGNAGGDCEFLFDSCPLESLQMLDYIRTSEKNILSRQFFVE